MRSNKSFVSGKNLVILRPQPKNLRAKRIGGAAVDPTWAANYALTGIGFAGRFLDKLGMMGFVVAGSAYVSFVGPHALVAAR